MNHSPRTLMEQRYEEALKRGSSLRNNNSSSSSSSYSSSSLSSNVSTTATRGNSFLDRSTSSLSSLSSSSYYNDNSFTSGSSIKPLSSALREEYQSINKNLSTESLLLRAKRDSSFLPMPSTTSPAVTTSIPTDNASFYQSKPASSSNNGIERSLSIGSHASVSSNGTFARPSNGNVSFEQDQYQRRSSPLRGNPISTAPVQLRSTGSFVTSPEKPIMQTSSYMGERERELIESLEVVVKANRALRSEVQSLREQLDLVTTERDSVLEQVKRETSSLKSMYQETNTASQILINTIENLKAEKAELARRLEILESENERLILANEKTSLTTTTTTTTSPAMATEESNNTTQEDPKLISSLDGMLKGNIADVIAINEALRESLALMGIQQTPSSSST